MTSILDSWIERTAEGAVRDYFNGDAFKAMLAKHVRWAVQGYEPGFGPKEREQFTQTVADYIHDHARRPIYLFGIRIWRAREPMEWCLEHAEVIVTEFLKASRIKFGDPQFYWEEGHELAAEDMSYWEAA